MVSEWAGGIWTNSTRPTQRRQLSQCTMRLLAPWRPNDRLRAARPGSRAHARSRLGGKTGLSRVAALSRITALSRVAADRHSWSCLATGNAGSIADAAEQEQPLVVMSAASLVEPERRFLALASDAHHSTAGPLAAGEWRRTRRGIAGRWSAEASRRSARTAADTRGLLRGASLPGNAAGSQDDVPLAVLGHRILVFLSKEPALHEHVETGRVVAAAHFPHVKVDGARNLLAAENQFGFLFPLGLSTPHRHRDGHDDHHDSYADQQRRHRVTALAALTTL